MLPTRLGDAPHLHPSLQELASLPVAVFLDLPLDAGEAFTGVRFVNWHE